MSIKFLYGQLLVLISHIFSLDSAKKIDAKLRFHRTLDLKNPKSLADKVTYIELHEQSPLAPMCTDKYAVREYIHKKGLEDILIPLVGGPWEKVDEVDFDNLPNSFALKATHGCKMNYIVSEKEKMDKSKCVEEMSRWLKTTYGTYSM